MADVVSDVETPPSNSLPTVLVPAEVADRCYLSEALLWVALNKIPLAAEGLNEVDERIDQNEIGGLEQNLREVQVVTDSECQRAGLPSNPEYEDFKAGDYHQTPENIRALLKLDLPKEDKDRLEIDLRESVAFHRRQAEWDGEFEQFLDIHKNRLFLALREGRLVALGKMLPKRTVSASLRHPDDDDYWSDWAKEPWEVIPSDYWLSNKIVWMESCAEGRGNAYALIQVKTEELFQVFPALKTDAVHGVVRIGDSFVIQDHDGSSVVPDAKRGRPPHNWDEFHLEIAKRLKADSLPKKQEALIAEMQSWCRQKWGRDIGRSTVLQKLKPYYDNFVRVAKNPTT